MTDNKTPQVTEEQVLDVLMKDETLDKLQERLAGDTETRKTDRHADKLDENEQWVYNTWMNNGWDRKSQQFKYSDLTERESHRIKLKDIVKKLQNLSSGTDEMQPFDRSLVMPRVVSRIVREAIEPNLVLTSLFQELRFNAPTPLVEFPELGTVKAAELGPNMEYPEETLEMEGRMVQIRTAKHGLAVRFSDEMVRFSQFDLMRMALAAGGRALARLKEAKAFREIQKAMTYIDNAGSFNISGVAPAGAFTSSGRDRTGAGNGTYTLNDLFSQYVHLYEKGFMPDMLIMNPMGWLIFALSPELRTLLTSQGQGFIAQQHQGQVGRNTPFETGTLGTLGKHSSVPEFGTQFTNVPSFFPVPLSIVVSPFIELANDVNIGANVTDIYMADRTEIGILVTDEDVMTDRWEDPSVDTVKTKLRERYGFATLHQGKGLNVARNVVIGKGFDFEDRMIWDASNTALPNVPGGAPFVQ